MNDDEKKERETVRPQEVSEALGVSLTSVYRAMREGEIPYTRLGKLYLIPRSWLDRIAAEGTAVAEKG